jgi:hypothetical protein
MPERDYSNNPEDYARDYPDGQHAGGVTPPTYQPVQGPTPEPQNNDPYADYNGGSPPDAPLNAGHGWEWNGSRWVQVQGRGLGYQAPAQNQPAPRAQQQQAPQQSVGGQVAGVPQSFSQWNPQAILGGQVPSLQSAIEGAKSLKPAPQIQPYQQFQAPTPVGLDQRNSILTSILNRPQVLDQQKQDQLFEQQKELQTALASQSRERAAQAGAGRGLSGTGGYAAASNANVDSELGRNLMQGQRDISVQAAQINRQAEQAALQMQEALSQGDFARAAQAYQMQIQAQNMFDEMQFKSAEFDRANVALSASTQMANRQQQMAEQMGSFQQYLAQKQFEEQMRAFNEQMGLNWSQFGWDQQFNTASLFGPRG